jgi:hypothetical protein
MGVFEYKFEVWQLLELARNIFRLVNIIFVTRPVSANSDQFQASEWRLALLEKLVIAQIIKKFHASYEFQRSITMFTRANQ